MVSRRKLNTFRIIKKTIFKIQKQEGIVAAPFNPMAKAGNINYDLIRPFYELLEITATGLILTRS